MEEFDFLFENVLEGDEEVEIPRVKRYIRDGENPLEFFNEADFKKRYRFTKDCVINVLLPLIMVDLEKITNRGLPISPALQLLIALRFYASNSFQIVHGDLRGFSQPSLSRVISRVSRAFANRLQQIVKFPSDRNAFVQNTALFYRKANFPTVSGCIDCTHIAIKNPGGDNGEIFRNRKGWFSLNVQVVAGPRLEIMDIVVRYPGSAHDSTIFNRSSLRARLHLDQIPGVLLGDSGYACSNKLLTPFLTPQDDHETRYNTAHIRTRNSVERLFGVWKRKFFCLKGGLRTKLPTTMNIICATAVLYNIGLTHNQNDDFHDNEDLIDINENVNAHPGGLAFRRAFAVNHF